MITVMKTLNQQDFIDVDAHIYKLIAIWNVLFCNNGSLRIFASIFLINFKIIQIEPRVQMTTELTIMVIKQIYSQIGEGVKRKAKCMCSFFIWFTERG